MKEFCALCMAWLLACLSTFGSVYAVEGFNLESCYLCWLQRIGIYPLILILGMATLNQCYTIIPYVVPQLFLGCILAVYHIIIQMNPSLEIHALCPTGPSCIEKFDIGMGFLTFPMLSVVAYSLIIGCLLYAWYQAQQNSQLLYVRIK